MNQRKIQTLSPALDRQEGPEAMKHKTKTKNIRIRSGLKAGDGGIDVIDIHDGILIRRNDSTSTTTIVS